MAALWVRPLVVVAPPFGTVAGKSTPSVPDVVTSIWLKFAVTLFAQAFETVDVPALAELAGKTKTAAAANASTASVLRRLDRWPRGDLGTAARNKGLRAIGFIPSPQVAHRDGGQRAKSP